MSNNQRMENGNRAFTAQRLKFFWFRIPTFFRWTWSKQNGVSLREHYINTVLFLPSSYSLCIETSKPEIIIITNKTLKILIAFTHNLVCLAASFSFLFQSSTTKTANHALEKVFLINNNSYTVIILIFLFYFIEIIFWDINIYAFACMYICMFVCTYLGNIILRT